MGKGKKSMRKFAKGGGVKAAISKRRAKQRKQLQKLLRKAKAEAEEGAVDAHARGRQRARGDRRALIRLVSARRGAGKECELRGWRGRLDFLERMRSVWAAQVVQRIDSVRVPHALL